MSKSGNKVKETKEERELAKIAGERYKVYKELYEPQIDRYISRVRMDEGDRSFAQAEARSSMADAYAQMERSAVSRMRPDQAFRSSGVFAPNSAMTTAQSFNDIDSQITDNHYRGLESVAKMGQGVATGAINTIGDIASNASEVAVHNAFQSEQRRQDNINGAMQLAGAGLAKYSSMPKKSPGLQIGQMPQHIPGNQTVTPVGQMVQPRRYFDWNGGGDIYG